MTGYHRSEKDSTRQRVRSKPFPAGSQSSSDEDEWKFALPPPHSSTSSSGSKKTFRASSMRSSPVLSEDVPPTHDYSSAGEYSACSSTGSGGSFTGSRGWRKKKDVILLIIA